MPGRCNNCCCRFVAGGCSTEEPLLNTFEVMHLLQMGGRASQLHLQGFKWMSLVSLVRLDLDLVNNSLGFLVQCKEKLVAKVCYS